MPFRPATSIVLLTRNAGPSFEAVLSSLRSQTQQAELIAVDSGSSDGTVQRLRDRGARVIEIAPSEFNHGETRNLAVSAASGDVAVFLVQDALPVSDDWLERLVEPFGDPSVAGTVARQQPWPDASALTKHYLARWAAARPEPRTVGPLARDAFGAMTPAQRHDACVFDNVCSAVRTSVWRAHPFRRTTIAEDLRWAAEVLLSGYRIVYVPESVVWHSHDRPVRYELERTYLVHQQLQALFGLSTIPTAGSLIRSVAVTLPAHVRIAASERGRRTRAMLRGLGLAVALPLGQYLGARSSREGREFLRARGI